MPPQTSPSPPAAAPSPGAGKTVLLAEDEPEVRSLVGCLLRGRGYVVLEAADADEALQVAEGHPGRIDLLLTDVLMPGANGRDLADRLTALRPGLRVLFMSGWTNSIVLRRGKLCQDNVDFLPKPFTPAVLARKVREVLERGAGG